MILIDYNQIFLANIFAQGKGDNINENLIRHTILSCTLSYKRAFGAEYGEIVFCSDGRGNYWRKSVYPYYKANRKKNREQSGLNWQPIFDSLNKIRYEIKEYMPYKMIAVETAEADDIIATIVKAYYKKEQILILSGDQDFIQLHQYRGVRQYSPIQKKYIHHNDPQYYLREKILRGDPGDGIPNFLSDDDCFVSPDKRQKPLREQTLQEYLKKDILEYEDNLLKNYYRNEQLINLLSNIPASLSDEILKCFDGQVVTRSKMMEYFMKNGLKILMESITEF